MTFPKDIVNSTFCKILQAHQDKSNPNLTVKQKEPVEIYFNFPLYGDKSSAAFKILHM